MNDASNPDRSGHRSAATVFFNDIRPETTHLELIRHGEASEETDPDVSGPLDTDLTEIGREQARRAGQRLADLDCDLLYASPLKRTTQTAELIAGEIGLDVQFEESIQEIDLTARAPDDMTLHEVYEEWGRILEQERERSSYPFNEWEHFHFAETGEEVRDRVMPFLRGLVDEHPGERIVVVTHAAVINIVIGNWLGVDHDFWFFPANTSLNKLRLWKDHAWVSSLNDTKHLVDARLTY